jgi:hypothetical protein
MIYLRCHTVAYNKQNYLSTLTKSRIQSIKFILENDTIKNIGCYYIDTINPKLFFLFDLV